MLIVSLQDDGGFDWESTPARSHAQEECIADHACTCDCVSSSPRSIADIILIETLARLKTWQTRHPTRGRYLGLDRIEATGILPQRTETVNDWTFERDLMGFPRAVDASDGAGARRKKWVAMGRRGERLVVVDDDLMEVETEAEVDNAHEVKVKPEEPDERFFWVKGSEELGSGLPNELLDAGSKSALPTTAQPNGSSSGMAIDLDADDDMDVDLPSSEEMIVVGPDNRTSAPSLSSRLKSELKVERHPIRPTAEQTNHEPQTVSGRHHGLRPVRQHMVRYQRTSGPPVPITKEYVKALRDIFIPPRPPPVNNEVEPEGSGFSNMRNQQELICPNGLCRQYGCLLHGEYPRRAVVLGTRLMILMPSSLQSTTLFEMSSRFGPSQKSQLLHTA